MRRIGSDPKIIVFETEELSEPHVDLNVDVEVHVQGVRWSATFFTLENIRSLMQRWAQTGECGAGEYCWAADMIIVRELSDEKIRDVVRHLLDDSEFERAFSRLEDG